MSTARANIKSEISADMSQFSATLRRASMSAQAAGAKISKGISSAAIGIAKAGAAATAAGAAIAATAAAAGLFKGMKGAAEIEQLGIAFEVMTGSAEKGRDILEQIRVFGAETPYEFPALAKGAQTLLAFGLAAEDVLPTLHMLGDIAAGNGEKMESLSLVFGQIASTGRLMGGDLLQLINAGFNPLQEISAKTGESMIELKKRMEAGLIPFSEVKQAFKDATSEGGKFFGMTARQSKTFNGLMSTVKDSINNALNEFAKPINIAIVPYLDRAIKLIDEITPKIAAMGERIASAMSGDGIDFNKIQVAFAASLEFAAVAFGEGLTKAIQIAGALMTAVFSKEGMSFIGSLLQDIMIEAINSIGNALFELSKTIKKVMSGEVTMKDNTRIIGTIKPIEEAPKTFADRMQEAIASVDFAPSDRMKDAKDKFTKTLGDIFPELPKKAESGSQSDIYDAEREAQRKRVAEDMATMKERSTPIGILGPSKSLMSKPKLPALGSDNVFARDRARLGLANGLSTGGLGAKRAFGKAGKDKDMKKSETLQEKSITTLESIDQKISQSLTVA